MVETRRRRRECSRRPTKTMCKSVCKSIWRVGCGWRSSQSPAELHCAQNPNQYDDLVTRKSPAVGRQECNVWITSRRGKIDVHGPQSQRAGEAPPLIGGKALIAAGALVVGSGRRV